MKTLLLILATLTIGLFSACSTTRTDSAAPKETSTGSNLADGSSYATAIVIHSAHEGEGVRMEYDWIRVHLPGFKPAGQSLQNHGGKVYDVIHLVSDVGEHKDVYFDIGEFFGKF